MIKFYKKIDVEHLEKISSECYSIIEAAGMPDTTELYYLDKDSADRFQNIASLKELMESLKLYEYWFCTAVVVSYVDLPIHTDTGSFHYSFNIPIKNTKNTYTTFYESNSTPVLQAAADGTTYEAFDNETVKFLDRIEMTQPAIVNTQIPHNVVHFTKNLPRITILLRLNMSFNPECFLQNINMSRKV